MPILPLLLVQPAQDITQTVVTAPRAGRTATAPGISEQVITAEELAATGERSLPRAIAKASGLFVQETNLGGGAPIVRGLIGNQILIVVDGVRLNDGTTRSGPNQSLNGIDPTNVERVEIIRGPNAVLYGSDALGGAILIWTRKRAPLSRDKEGTRAVQLEAGVDANTAAEGAREYGSLSVATEDVGVLVGGSFQDWQMLHSGKGEVQNTGYHGQSWYASSELQLAEKRSIRVSAMRTRDFDVPRSDRMNTGYGQTQPADAENYFTLQDRARYIVAYNDSALGFADQMQARLSLRDYTENRRIKKNVSAPPPPPAPLVLESDNTQTVGLGMDWRKAVGQSHLLTWGLDVDRDVVESTRTTDSVRDPAGAFAPGSEYLSSGVFLRDEMFDVGPFDLTAGLRYSYFDFSFDDTNTPDQTIDGHFDAFTGSLQAATDVAEGVRVTATLAQAFRAPNLAELARKATFNSGTELSNPDLDPEHSLYEELALDMRREAWNWSLGLYHNGIQDVIGRRLVNDPTPGGSIGDETYQRENTGDVDLYGIETRYQRKLGGPDSPYTFGTYLEYTYGVQYDDDIAAFDGQPASRIPPFHGNVTLGWEPAQAVNNVGWLQLSMWFATSQNRLSPQDLGDPRIDKNGTNGWVRFDLDLGGPVGEAQSGATWHFGAHNLFGEEYRVHGSGIDGPGFGVVAGLRMTL